MQNKDLKQFYDNVYKKGEKRHYTSLLLSGDNVPPAKDAVLKEISWRGKRVLDAGCGTGELPHLIAKKGAMHVLGIDYSKDAIEVAKKSYRAPNLSFECTDIEHIFESHQGKPSSQPSPSLRRRGRERVGEVVNRFDVICSLGTLEHVDDPLSVLRQFKKMLASDGSIIITCPNWVNPRGYMLLMLKYLFDARITLADIHFFTPLEFEQFAKKLGMHLKWKTVEHEWGHGAKLIRDFEKRLPNVLRDSKLPYDEKRVSEFLTWLKTHLTIFEKKTEHGGAVALYHLTKR